ncbi:MAG: bifunctional hydroxymethylpyrimidine kinase/phosphomethylpyrimidine kinase [Candidatus Binatus sp.]
MPPSNSKHPVALTIAGSDPGGGAGIQADLKTFAALGVYGYSVLTEVIAQNSWRVANVEQVSPQMVEAQLDTLALEFAPRAMKTGALANADVVKAVARAIERLKLPAPVVDPVIVSSSGARLIGPKGERAIRKRLVPLAAIVTPNIPEAEGLADIQIDSAAAIRQAAMKIIQLGARAVVIKGGHREDDRSATDYFFDGRNFLELKGPRIAGGGAHGTGCAFSAAIAAHLARGVSLEDAVRGAKRFVTVALRQSFKLGKGRALLDHFARG